MNEVMTDIRIEMNYYPSSGVWAIIVLYHDVESISASLNWFFDSKDKGKAYKKLAEVEDKYNVRGTIHE